MRHTTLRHDESLVRSYAVTHPAAHVVLPQPPGWDQLLLTERGVMAVRTEEESWLVPPHRALWAPSGVHHEIRTSGRVQVRCLYLTEGIVTDPGPCRAVELRPFTRSLVLHAVANAPLWADDDRDAHLVAVLADELADLDVAPLRLPTPRDPRAREVAAIVLDDPGSADDVTALARRVATSRRTLERLFVAETDMTVGRWRTQARLHAAIALLEAGTPVTRVAADVGYSTPSAFGAAFRQALGTSPSRFLADRTGTPTR